MTEQDGFRIEAAGQFGFETTNDDADEFKCTEAQLIAFAKSCEGNGLVDALQVLRAAERSTGDQHEAVILGEHIHTIEGLIAAIGAELAPIVQAERVRFLTSRGYVPIDASKPEGGWVKPC